MSKLKVTGYLVPYGITQCYLPPDTSESTQPVKAGTGFTYRKDGRLS